MRVDDHAIRTVPIVYDRALTHVIRSRRLLEETERRLSEALMILGALDDPGTGDAGMRAALTRQLGESIQALSDVRAALRPLSERDAPPP